MYNSMSAIYIYVGFRGVKSGKRESLEGGKTYTYIYAVVKLNVSYPRRAYNSIYTSRHERLKSFKPP